MHVVHVVHFCADDLRTKCDEKNEMNMQCVVVTARRRF